MYNFMKFHMSDNIVHYSNYILNNIYVLQRKHRISNKEFNFIRTQISLSVKISQREIRLVCNRFLNTWLEQLPKIFLAFRSYKTRKLIWRLQQTVYAFRIPYISLFISAECIIFWNCKFL